MVAGGTVDGTSSEILDLATLEWRTGPQLPEDIRFMASFQYGDTFALAGGFSSESWDYLNTVYLYDLEVHSRFPVSNLIDSYIMFCRRRTGCLWTTPSQLGEIFRQLLLYPSLSFLNVKGSRQIIRLLWPIEQLK